MRTPDHPFRKLVLVCTNQKEPGVNCCAMRGGEELFFAIKERVKQVDPSIRVSRTGCLGNCLSGSIVVVMPDDLWFGEVTMEDIPIILEKILA